MDFFIHMQLKSHFEREGEYGLSINVDVALWLDSRAHNGMSPLRKAHNFVVIDSTLHDEFDAFKKAEVDPEYSLLPVCELLEFWYQGLKRGSMQPIFRFGRRYLRLHCSDVDQLVRWVLQMQDQLHLAAYKRDPKRRRMNTATSPFCLAEQ